MDGVASGPFPGTSAPGQMAAPLAPETQQDFCSWWHFWMAMALSGAAGIRATLPVFLLSLMHQIEPEQFPLSDQAHWLRHPEICFLLGIGLLVEILADQIPAVDHALHAVLTPVHPLAGAAAAVAPNYCGGLASRVPMAFVGGALAGMVHSGKAMVRMGATGSSAGMLNPVVSHCENFATFALVIFSILSPLFALLATALFIGVGLLGFKMVREALNLNQPEDKKAGDEESGSASARLPLAAAPAREDLDGSDDDAADGQRSPQSNRSGNVPRQEAEDEEARREVERILAAPNLHWVLGGGTAAGTKQEYRRLQRLLGSQSGRCPGERGTRARARLQEAHDALLAS